jgi:hypothetical protein
VCGVRVLVAFYVVADAEGEGRRGVVLIYDCSVGCDIIEHYTLAVAIATVIAIVAAIVDVCVVITTAAVVIVIVVVIAIIVSIVYATIIADIAVYTIVAVLRIERRTGKSPLVPDPSDPPPIRAVTHNFRFRERNLLLIVQHQLL